MKKFNVIVFILKDTKRFDAFILDETKSVKTKTESYISEENAVNQIAKIELGEKLFKYNKIENGWLSNKWEVEEVEPKINSENTVIYEIKGKKSRAADMAKSRAKADFLRDVRLTPKANEQLNRLCEQLALNKTQVINKLLEEQEQLKLL